MTSSHTEFKIERKDHVAILAYLLIALTAFVGRFTGGHVDILISDAGAIASAVASRLQPGGFSGDLMLANPKLTDFYTTALTQYLQVSNDWFGGIANAFVALSVPVITCHLIGYHLLARQLGSGVTVSAVFTLMMLVQIDIGIRGEYFGLTNDPISRILYQSAFPFVLLLVARSPRSYKMCAAVMVASGLLVYAHPHSAATQAFAMLCGFSFLKPQGDTRLKHASKMLTLGILFLVISAPFILSYISATSSDAATAQAPFVREIVAVRLGDYLSPGKIALKFALESWHFLVVAPIAGIWIWRTASSLRPFLLFLAGWSVGLFFIAAIVPIVEHAIAAHLKILPFEYDFIRALRYVVPIACLLFVIASNVYAQRFCKLPHIVHVLTVAIVLGAATSAVTGFPRTIIQGGICLAKAQVPCPMPPWEENVHQVLKAVVDLPQHARILPENAQLGLSIRHSARKPAVYTWKDGGWLIYAKDYATIKEWYRRKLKFDRLETFVERNPETGALEVTDPEGWFSTFRELALEFDAQYIVMARDARDLPISEPNRILFASQYASLVQVSGF